jgi:hypoxanthine-guanine phosphoribosyltransferase
MEKYMKSQVISLKDHPEFTEKWVQARIEEDPSIIGLGEITLKDSERPQPSGGRLDLLLHDYDSNTRYEVELQLGRSDESHIIRTVEYWDYQRKKFPQYQHCAVLIAEDITTRFLNVVSLFNGNIPFIAIQMKAIKMDDVMTLFFTTVLDVVSLGTDEEDEAEVVDRKYWETKGSKESLKLADDILDVVDKIASGYTLKYNKHYIGLSKQGISKNFISVIPRKKAIVLKAKLPQTDETQELLDRTDMDVMPYEKQWNQYRIRLTEKDLQQSKAPLMQLIRKAYESYEA